MTETAPESPEVQDAVRSAVRGLLLETPAFAQVPAEERKELANKLVTVGLLAARLAETEEKLTRQVAKTPRAPIATAQSASDQLGMKAVKEAGNTVKALKDSVGFPEFVQSLITGTFQAILTSSTAQLGSLGELLDNVSASSEEFDSTIQDGEVRSWVLARFSFLKAEEGTVVMRNAEADIFDHQTQLKAALAASEDEVSGIDSSDLEGTLLPLAKRKIGRDKQGILATLVGMGLQRIVVDEGRLEASMDLRVDAQSQSQENQQALDSLGVTAGASANMMFGPVGASAYASTSIGRVRSDVQQTSEQIAARAGLRSSVQLAFRTEQVPLDRMANDKARVRIGQNARVPDVAAGSILSELKPIEGVKSAPPTPAAAPTAPAARPPAAAAPVAAPVAPVAAAVPRPPGTPAPAAATAPAAPAAAPAVAAAPVRAPTPASTPAPTASVPPPPAAPALPSIA